MRLYFLLVFVFVFSLIKAQNVSSSTIYGIDNKVPKTYKIGQIKVEGAITEPLAVVVRSGLAQGDNVKIPGEQLGNAIKKLWDTGLFTDVQILIDEVRGDQLFLVIKVEQTPKINEFVFIGIKKSEKKELKELLASLIGARVSNNTDFQFQ
jgi:outer membrane protein insertion porin family